MDLVSNLISILKTGQRARKDSVVTPTSKMICAILSIMREKGYIVDFEEHGEKVKEYRVILKYSEAGEPVIRDMVRVSKSSRREYKGKDELPRIANGFGTVIVSTSRGVMTGNQAKAENHGGEVICYVV